MPIGPFQPTLTRGAYDLSAQFVHRNTTRLLKAGQLPGPPAWYAAMSDIPPSGRSIVRPALQQGRAQRLGNRAGRRPARGMFKPTKIGYEEDSLRTEFFKDHPWELARPRVVVEDQGNDAKGQNWSVPIGQAAGGRGADGESVVQRQLYLMQHKGLTREESYDVARRELYWQRHRDQVEVRVAREEAIAVGGYFGQSTLDVGAKLEDQVWEKWREEAIKKGEDAMLARRQKGMVVDEEDLTIVGEGEDGDGETLLGDAEKAETVTV